MKKGYVTRRQTDHCNMIDKICKLNRKKEMMVDKKVKLARITNFIINNKEQYAYLLEQNCLKIFAVSVVGYRDGDISPTLSQLGHLHSDQRSVVDRTP